MAAGSTLQARAPGLEPRFAFASRSRARRVRIDESVQSVFWFAAANGARVSAHSPNGEQADQSKRYGGKPEIEPSAMACGVLWHLEKLDHEADGNGIPREHSKEISRCLIGCPDGFALRRADA